MSWRTFTKHDVMSLETIKAKISTKSSQHRGLMNIPLCCGTKVFNIKMMSRDDGVNIIHAYFQNLQEIYLCKTLVT